MTKDRIELPPEISEEALARLERYGSTVISGSTLDSFGGDAKAVADYLESKGFAECSCRAIPDEYIDAEGHIERSVTVIISGKPKSGRNIKSYER